MYRRPNPRLGRCFELSFHKVTEPGAAPATLVHGIIRSRHLAPQDDGTEATIFHGWVEFENGDVWEPVSEVTVAKEAFLRLYAAEELYRYTRREAILWAWETKHSGPWEELPEHIEEQTL